MPKQKTSFMKKLFKFALHVAFWAVVAGIVGTAFLVVRYGSDLPDYKKLAIYAPPVATRLYAADGSLLIEYAEERRVFIDFSDVPPQLINAFVAAEDKNFWTHPGIDVFGIARAGMNNMLKVIGFGTRFTGASTITQQVAKNFFLTSERTISRKIKEAILALKLERAFSKQHIMTLYLNQIFLGARAYGVGSASLMYFNKPVKDLTLGEIAFMASLPKAPNAREKAAERRNYVLRRMYKEGFITKEEATSAAVEPLIINSGFTAQMQDDFQYFAEEVRKSLLEHVGRETLYNDGLYVKTTIVPELQRAAAAALKKALDEYDRARPNAPEKLQGAIIAINPHTGRVLAMSGGRSFAQSPFNRATQGLRQIGSTIKPFVYLAALEKPDQFTPQTLLLDAPIVGWREDNSQWKPENYDKKFLGDVPLRLSLETSRNVPTVRLVETIGIRTAINAAQRFGVYPNDMKNLNLSYALGSGETTLERLTLGFAAFINGGYRNPSKYVDYIQDRYGNNIGFDTGKKDVEWSDNLMPPEVQNDNTPLSDPRSLYQVVSILQGAVEMGTGKQARVSGHTIAGKTGTTNDVKDVWFIGFSKDMVVGVYLGLDNPAPLGPGTGSHMAGRVFSDFMSVALKGEKNRPFAVPNGMEFIRVDRGTGVAAAYAGPNAVIITEAFKEGQSPNKSSADSRQSSEKHPEPVPIVGGIF
jgi:penicillin-binding protein 1A